MNAAMRDLDHPAHRRGGEWVLVLLLAIALGVLGGGAVLTYRNLHSAPLPSIIPESASPELAKF